MAENIIEKVISSYNGKGISDIVQLTNGRYFINTVGPVAYFYYEYLQIDVELTDFDEELIEGYGIDGLNVVANRSTP